MRLLEHPLYLEDVAAVAETALPWTQLQNRSVMISGATGMIGSFLIDVIMYRNQHHQLNCTLYTLGRSEAKAQV